MSTHRLTIKNAYLDDRDEIADIAIDDGRITSISTDPIDEGGMTIDANGNLVSPPFVDCHMHLDKSHGACGHRTPQGHDKPFDYHRLERRESEYFTNATESDITRNAIKNIQLAVANGTTQIRTHVLVDNQLFGLQNLNAVIEAGQQTRNLVDLQIGPTARHQETDAGQALLKETVDRLVAEGYDRGDIFIGGDAPQTGRDDFDSVVEAWFKIAAANNVGVDAHVSTPGSLGRFTLERMAALTEEYDLADRVTASHAFCLAHLPSWVMEETAELLANAGVGIATCHSSSRATMPYRELRSAGVPLGQGTDNDRDFVILHGTANQIEGAMVQANKLLVDSESTSEYRWYASSPGLRLLWEMITVGSAETMQNTEYGIAEGGVSDLVIFDRPSPEWCIAAQATPQYVIKEGNIIAKDGEIIPEFRVVEEYDDVLTPPID